MSDSRDSASCRGSLLTHHMVHGDDALWAGNAARVEELINAILQLFVKHSNVV